VPTWCAVPDDRRIAFVIGSTHDRSTADRRQDERPAPRREPAPALRGRSGGGHSRIFVSNDTVSDEWVAGNLEL
jgi:hypothetical protein